MNLERIITLEIIALNNLIIKFLNAFEDID